MKDNNKRLIKNVRIMQAIFIGVFTLGLSMMGGDLATELKLPFSSFSLTTTMFGMMGYLICEWFTRKAMSW